MGLWRETALLSEDSVPLSHRLVNITVDYVQLDKTKPKIMEVISDMPKVTKCESTADMTLN